MSAEPDETYEAEFVDERPKPVDPATCPHPEDRRTTSGRCILCGTNPDVAAKQSEEPSQALAVLQPAQLLALAINKGMDLETVSKFMDLYERWEAKQALQAFNRAMTKFQALVPEIPKDKKGYKTDYAPLGTIEKVIKASMAECGLSKDWKQIEEPSQVTIICVITHEGGHSKERPIGPVPWSLLEKTDLMNGLQHRAATITYLQRYSLIGALGLTTADADSDGRDPKGDKGRRKQEEPQSITDQLKTPRATGPRKINKEEADQLGEAAKESGIPTDDAKQIVRDAGFEKTSLITIDKFPDILAQVGGWESAERREHFGPNGDATTPGFMIEPANVSAIPGETEQLRIKAREFLDAVVDAGYRGDIKTLLKSATGVRDLKDVAADKLPGLISRLETELRGLRAMAN